MEWKEIEELDVGFDFFQIEGVVNREENGKEEKEPPLDPLPVEEEEKQHELDDVLMRELRDLN